MRHLNVCKLKRLIWHCKFIIVMIKLFYLGDRLYYRIILFLFFFYLLYIYIPDSNNIILIDIIL